MTTSPGTPPISVSLLTLGCARNDVDSEELAGRLAADGFQLVDDPEDADTVVVNTCGFVDAAKKDSIDTLLAASDLKETGRTQAVVAVGCLAERYGENLAAELPEADAVLGFDDYGDIGARLRSILAGDKPHPHTPTDRRLLLPITPAERHPSTGSGAGQTFVAGASGTRTRLDDGPMAPLKLANGCDRRCTFCAIPMFRGSFVSRRPSEVLDEARWLAAQGVRELFLVSENNTSYGKDLGDIRLLETLLPEVAAIDGIERVRVSYLQPAETRPGLIEAIATTPGVAAYFDLSFQHASGPVLRRMRRFGDAESFLGLLDRVRAHAPAAGVRSNVIVGFPGETEADLQVLTDFLVASRMDVTGVFGYSDEDGTEAEGFDGKLDEDEIRARVEHVTDIVTAVNAERAEERIGEEVVVLVESLEPDDAAEPGDVEGRAEHQGPEVDGTTYVAGLASPRIGQLVRARVVASDGVDLIAESMEDAQ